MATIMFVDDEPNVTAAVQRAFRQLPYKVITASSAAEALAILAQTEVDVVISDERMPGMPGSVLLGEVRRKYPDTVRIILSGQANLEDVMRAINDGEIYRFFIKPFNAVDLGVTVKQALEHKQLIKTSRRLLRKYQRQAQVIKDLEHSNPALTQLETDNDGAIVMDGEDDCDVEALLADISLELDSKLK
jgi:DNA-binding NtrC family response regulator